MLSVLEDDAIVPSIAQPRLIKGRAKTNTIHTFQNLNVSRSLSTVRSNRLRAATMPERTVLRSTVKFSSAPQARTGRAPKHHGHCDAPFCRSITHDYWDDFASPHLSPVWLYMFCECTVVKMIAANTTNHPTNFVSRGKGTPRATSVGYTK